MCCRADLPMDLFRNFVSGWMDHSTDILFQFGLWDFSYDIYSNDFKFYS